MKGCRSWLLPKITANSRLFEHTLLLLLPLLPAHTHATHLHFQKHDSFKLFYVCMHDDSSGVVDRFCCVDTCWFRPLPTTAEFPSNPVGIGYGSSSSSLSSSLMAESYSRRYDGALAAASAAASGTGDAESFAGGAESSLQPPPPFSASEADSPADCGEVAAASDRTAVRLR